MSYVRRSYSCKWTSGTTLCLLVQVLSHCGAATQTSYPNTSREDRASETCFEKVEYVVTPLLSHFAAVVTLQQQDIGNTDMLSLGCTWESPKAGKLGNCYLSLPIPLYTCLPEPKPNTTEVKESSFDAKEVCTGSKRTLFWESNVVDIY